MGKTMSGDRLSTADRSILDHSATLEVNPESLKPSEYLRYIARLRGYIYDPDTASRIDANRTQSNLPAYFDDYGYVDSLADSARSQLEAISHQDERTFLERELARGIVLSPVAMIFDEREEHSHDLISQQEITAFSHARYLGERAQHEEVLSEGQISILLQAFINNHPDVSDDEMKRWKAELERRRFAFGIEDIKTKRAFTTEEARLIEAGYLTPGQLYNDVAFLEALINRNIMAANQRLWQIAFSIDSDAQAKIEGYHFPMRAYGDVVSGMADPVFYERFLDQEEVDYTEILEHGFMYAPVRVAPGVIGFYESTGQLVKMFDMQNATPDDPNSPVAIDLGTIIDTTFSDATIAKGVEQKFYQIAGDLESRYIIEKSLGIRLDDLALSDQLSLIVLLERTSYEQMQAIKRLSPDLTIAVANAMEFGEDYGDSILEIVQNVSLEQATKIFESIGGFRQRTHEFANWFRDYDPDFAEATERAMNERLTDSLTGLGVLAKQGSLHVDVAPHRHKDDYESDGRFMCNVNSIDEGIEIIKQLDRSMKMVHDVITAADVRVSRVNRDDDQFIMYRFSSEAQGDALLYVRPEGAKGYDRDYEYGNKKGVEASISFIVNPNDPHHLRSDKDPDAVSFRFDREGRMADDSPFAEDRDPTKKDGTISLDISSGMGDPRRMPVKIGRFIAAGNILRAQKTGSHESLHHNTNYFDQSKYGKASGFAKLAIYNAHMAEAMIYLQNEGRHRSRYDRLPGVLRQADVIVAA